MLFKSITANNSWKIAIEFRDSSWYTEDTYNLIDAYGATIVIHDKSRVAPPHMTLKSKAIYIRFHGPQGDYRGTYDEAFLHEYAAYIYEWLVEGKSVFVYFNNTMGKAFDNLKKLNDYVRLCKERKGRRSFMNRNCQNLALSDINFVKEVGGYNSVPTCLRSKTNIGGKVGIRRIPGKLFFTIISTFLFIIEFVNHN